MEYSPCEKIVDEVQDLIDRGAEGCDGGAKALLMLIAEAVGINPEKITEYPDWMWGDVE